MTIERIIAPRVRNLGDFSIQRLLPVAKQRMVGPWIFFDHMGPATFSAGEGINVLPHPHINLATVTYLFEGEILHRDSLGSLQAIRPGDVNLMVAGSGITHSERERDEVKNTKRRLHGLQLWHVLPEDQEEIQPAFYHHPADHLPKLEEEGGVSIRVMIGDAYGLSSPVLTFAKTLYVEASVPKGQSLKLPSSEELAVYIVSGTATIAEQRLNECHMAVLESSSTAILEAHDDCRIAIIGGEKMSERFIDWNFVSSRKDRIEKAKSDWRSQRFPRVVGDEKEFVPLPE